MTREEILKSLRPLEWRELKLACIVSPTYKADQFIDGYAFISQHNAKWFTSFDEVEYPSLSEAMQAAEEYRKNKILSHFNLNE